MVTATENLSPAPAAVDASAIIDTSMRSGPQRTIQALADALIFENDDARGKALVAKRLVAALYADFGLENKEGTLSEKLWGDINALQEKFRPIVQNTPYEQLLESGQLQELLSGYM